MNNNEEFYDVESIVDYRRCHGRVEYFIKWVGYSSEQNTWEPMSNLEGSSPLPFKRINSNARIGCKELVLQFHQTKKKQIRRRRRRSRKENNDLNQSSLLEQEQSNSLPLIKFKRPSSFPVDQTSAWEHILKNADGPPITVINEVDDTGPPLDFTYINTCIPSPGISILDSKHLLGCSCTAAASGGNQTCNSFSCLMVAETGAVAYDKNGRVQIPYSRTIYECNKNCRCDPATCANRVIQNGPKNQLQIFRTLKTGWGVRALQFIPKGTFIITYTGLILTSKEAEKQGKKDDYVYLFDLDKFSDTFLKSKCPFFPSDSSVLLDDGFTVDAHRYGNIARFFNHSCDPNLLVYTAFIDSQDVRLHSLAIFAVRDIEIGEELTINYCGDAVLPSPTTTTSTNLRFRECYCGKDNCRKVIPL